MDEAAINALFPGYISLGFIGDTVKLRVPDWNEAWKLNQSHLRYLAGLARFLGKEQLEIHHDTPGKPPIPILAKMADAELIKIKCWEAHYQKLLQTFEPNSTAKSNEIGNVLENKKNDVEIDMTNNLELPTPEQIARFLSNVNARRLLEFELETIDRGLIVSFTSQRTNLCIKSSDLVYARPGRSIWKPYKYRGFNYMIAWDTDFSGKPSGEFVRMQEFLQGDSFVPNFDYNLRRPGDNALVRYQSSFYLFPDPSGEPGGIRACVSRQPDFWIIEEGDIVLAGR